MTDVNESSGQRADIDKLASFSRTCLGIVAAIAGGVAFSLGDLPAPWLTGGILAVAAIAVTRPVISPPRWLSNASLMALGVSVGSRLTPDSFANAALWPASLVAMCTVLALTYIGSYYCLITFFQWDKGSAFWASSPGALSLALYMATEAKADVVKVAVVQLTRVFALMVILPLGFRGSTLSQAFPEIDHQWLTIVLFLASYGLGILANKIKIPVGMLFGGIAGGVLFMANDVLKGASPNALVTPACIVISSSVGARFSGVRPRQIVDLLVPSTVSCLVALLICLCGSVAASIALGLPLPQVLVAYAPGGLDALIIVSILIGADSVYVTAHQIARFALLSACLPIIGRLHERMTGSTARDT